MRPKISNAQLALMSGYKVLAVIDEDPLYWTDAEYELFDNAEAEIEFFLNHGDFVLVETYERYPDAGDVPSVNEGVVGARRLVVFAGPAWREVAPALLNGAKNEAAPN